MPGENPERQYLIARESDMWLAEGRATGDRLEGMDSDDPEAQREKAWLDHIRARRDELDEELLNFARHQDSRRRGGPRKASQGRLNGRDGRRSSPTCSPGSLNASLGAWSPRSQRPGGSPRRTLPMPALRCLGGCVGG